MAQVSARKRGNSWEYRIEFAKIDGKRQQKSKGGFKTKAEALKEGTAVMNRYNNGGIAFEPSNISMSDYLDYYYKNYCVAQLKETTYTKYEKNIRVHLKPSLGQYRLASITTPVLQDFINLKYNKGYSRNTLCNLKALLTGSMEYAINSGFLASNPAKRVKIPSARVTSSNENTRKKERISLTHEQIVCIFNRFPEGHTSYIPLMIGYHCGLRIAETFALTWDDIDLKNKTLNVNKQIQWLHKKWVFTNCKYESSRIINLDSTIVKALKRYKVHQYENKIRYGEYYQDIYVNEHNELDASEGKKINMLCRKEDGSYLQSRSQQHTNYIIHTKLGIEKYDYHTLRHTHATMLLESGAPIKGVQQRLGHKNIKETLDIYAHCTPVMNNDTINILEKIM